MYDMVVDAQFHKFYCRPRPHLLYAFVMKDIGRWLPWVLPGSTGQLYKDDAVHNHSAHENYITPIEGRCKIYVMLLHVQHNQTKIGKNCHPYNMIIRSGYISDEIQFDEWKDERNQRRIMKKLKKLDLFQQARTTPWLCCRRSQQRSSPGSWLRLTALFVLIERLRWIPLLSLLFCSWYMTKPISHTCYGRRSCRPARYLWRSDYIQISKRCLATALRVSSSITTRHYVPKKDVHPKRLSS